MTSEELYDQYATAALEGLCARPLDPGERTQVSKSYTGQRPQTGAAAEPSSYPNPAEYAQYYARMAHAIATEALKQRNLAIGQWKAAPQ